jgi:hypothetical protein
VIEGKRYSLVKPSLQTPYHIDFDWWRQNDRDWRVYLRSYLAPEDQLTFSEISEEEEVDIVDPETAEVSRVDAMQHVLITRYANRSDFISRNTSMTEAIFRLFLTNGNAPLPVVEIAEKIGRSPNTVLQMLSGRRVYKGLRPCTLN